MLRLCGGWHFYREGTKKVDYDPHTRRFSVSFSAEPFFRQAVGPVAEWVKDYLPSAYNWERYLAVPRQVRPSTIEELEARQKWDQEYAARRKEAAAKQQPLPVEFPPYSPYYAWGDRIATSWQQAFERFTAIEGLSDEQKEQAAAALRLRRQQLANYLASQNDAIAEWEHELWRLQQLRADAGAVDLPFLGTRIEEKKAETTAASGEWIAQVQSIAQAFRTDLRGLLTDEQVGNGSIGSQVDAALQDANERKLHFVNVAVTIVVTGVGVLLLLGLFTRLAAIVGIGFLLSVMATQPPWVAGANNPVFYYQLVEIAGLIVLFATAAGRWAGLDYIIHGLLSGRRES
ncbi:MAG: DoxX family membrane protein [Pirellulales bacterium]|nr:DoxX family membrane protein [Pirellulales bacterium]